MTALDTSRRPRIAADIVETLLDDLEDHSQLEALREVLRERWTPLVRHHLHGADVSTIEAFMAKYPGLEEAAEAARKAIRDLWGDVAIQTELHTDPETCPVCWERQNLVLKTRVPANTWEKKLDQFDESGPYHELLIVSVLPDG